MHDGRYKKDLDADLGYELSRSAKDGAGRMRHFPRPYSPNSGWYSKGAADDHDEGHGWRMSPISPKYVVECRFGCRVWDLRKLETTTLINQR